MHFYVQIASDAAHLLINLSWPARLENLVSFMRFVSLCCISKNNTFCFPVCSDCSCWTCATIPNVDWHSESFSLHARHFQLVSSRRQSDSNARLCFTSGKQETTRSLSRVFNSTKFQLCFLVAYCERIASWRSISCNNACSSENNGQYGLVVANSCVQISWIELRRVDLRSRCRGNQRIVEYYRWESDYVPTLCASRSGNLRAIARGTFFCCCSFVHCSNFRNSIITVTVIVQSFQCSVYLLLYSFTCPWTTAR